VDEKRKRILKKDGGLAFCARRLTGFHGQQDLGCLVRSRGMCCFKAPPISERMDEIFDGFRKIDSPIEESWR
jgi:hypothetical protein